MVCVLLSARTILQSDIRKSNDATVEMAIADFFHCENIPDAVVESSRFKRMISVCRLLGDKFVPPNAKKLGGALLDLNFTITYERNKEELLKEAGVFGLAFMGDGATIHRTPNATDECSCHVWYEFSRDCRYY